MEIKYCKACDMIKTNPGVCVVFYISLPWASLIKCLDFPFLPSSTKWGNQYVDSLKDTVTEKNKTKPKHSLSRKLMYNLYSFRMNR